jgi:hypothetical protein
VKKCLSIKGAEDTINKPHAFEISTTDDNMFFIADSDKEKEDWINAVGRAIVKHSRRWGGRGGGARVFGQRGPPSRGPWPLLCLRSRRLSRPCRVVGLSAPSPVRRFSCCAA